MHMVNTYKLHQTTLVTFVDHTPNQSQDNNWRKETDNYK